MLINNDLNFGYHAIASSLILVKELICNYTGILAWYNLESNQENLFVGKNSEREEFSVYSEDFSNWGRFISGSKEKCFVNC